jgi:hypothetical protein
MRTGTFRCWLFGHKFISKNEKHYHDAVMGLMVRTSRTPLPYCIRCGIPRKIDGR